MKIIKTKIKQQASRGLVLALSTMMTLSLLGACVAQGPTDATVPGTSGTSTSTPTEVDESTGETMPPFGN